MISALIFLQVHSFRNRTRQRLKRLKQPKYLIGAIIGGLYFYFYFFRFLFQGGRGRSGQWLANPEDVVLYESLGAAVLLLMAFLAWVLPQRRAALTFTEAEIAFLFPAPISRRGLIHYKLLRSQVAIFFTVLLLTLLSNRMGGRAWIHAGGWWVVLSTISLHGLASSFTRTMLLDRGITNWQRRAVVLGLAAAVVVFILWWARQEIPGFQFSSLTDAAALKEYAGQVTESGPLPYILFPFRLVVRPYLASDALGFLQALGPALAILLGLYALVVRSNVAFEEASVEASRKLAEKVAAVRAGNWQAAEKGFKPRRPPFELQPHGPALVALFWKNLIHATQQFSLRLVLILAVMFLALFAALGNSPIKSNVPALMLMLLGISFIWSIMLGPQFLRQDLRQDLPLADLLKSYPLPAWQIVLGELLAPVAVLSVIQWVLVFLAVITASSLKPAALGWAVLVGAAAGLAILVPVLNLILFQIPNAAVLLFPGWFQTGKDSPQGIEATGQRIIFMLGQVLALIVALLPAAVAGGVAFALFQFIAGLALAIPAAAVASTVVLAVEAALGIFLLGKVFERLDISAESTP